ncbi:tetratricopeptide repeat protein [Aquimarina megaterium]|uniref:tetratricopeptide repeat protein n=1 Tax=Aquimarina megaterium TaxID=1443666 RepID=UPI0004708D8A|nr:tetratricopeptide repeat protein [Aquimarina megaterium]
MKKTTLTIFFFLIVFNVFGQNQVKIDSLLQELKTKVSDKEKVDVYNLLADQYTSTDSTKTFNYANQAINLAQQIKYTEGVADAYYQIAWATMLSKKYEKSAKIFQKVVDISQEIQYLKGESNGYNGLGATNYHKQGNFYETMVYFHKSLEVKKKMGDKRGVASFYNNMGFLHSQQNDYSKALVYYQKCLESYEELKDQQNIAYANGNIAIANFSLSNYTQSLKYYNISLKYFEKINDKVSIANLYNNIGLVFYKKSKYPKAITYYFKAMNILEELGDKKGVATSYNLIAAVIYDQGDYTKSLEYHLKSLNINKEINDKAGIAVSYNNIGDIYGKQNDIAMALDYYFKSLKIKKELNNRMGMIRAYISIGNSYTQQKNSIEALEYLQKGLPLSNEIGNHSLSIELYNALGRVYYQLNNYIQAKEYLTKGIKLAQKIDFPTEIRDGSLILSKAEKALGNHKAALASYELYHTTYDSLLGEEKSKQLSQLQVQYETEKKEQEIKSLAQQASIQSLELKQANFNKTIFGIVSLVLLLLGLVLYLVNRQKRLALQQRAQDIEQNLLRVQMNPHFIFNAMTSIQDYMNQGNAKQASLYLVKFSKLIRQVLDNSRSEFISLDQEINMLDNYLSIQNLKRDHPFTFKIEVEDGLIPEEIAIPPMFAQPFVENAIEHGVTSLKEGATIHIHFSIEGEHLVLKILDNGSGIEEAIKVKRKDHVSHAIKITEERIDLYRKMRKKKIAFDIQNLSQGTQVTFTLPFQYV